MENVLNCKTRKEFREWLSKNHNTFNECWLVGIKRGKPNDDNNFYYLDAVEEVLCFGWIDSVLKNIDGVQYQRFSPRSKNSNWTQLNRARVKRLNVLGLMTEDGLKVVPKDDFVFDKEILNTIKQWGLENVFDSLPNLYKKIRIDNLVSTRKRSIDSYKKSLIRFQKSLKDNKLIPGWDDYGRLKDFYDE